jgi:hypothetical protein
MTDTAEEQIATQAGSSEGGRIGAFATYFKGYMGASAIVVAALPIPVEEFRLIPAYASQRGLLAVYTSLFAFLLLAFLFYSRHRIAGSMFSLGEPGVYRTKPLAAWLPLALVFCSMAMVFCYQSELSASVRDRRAVTGLVGIAKATDDILGGTSALDVPRAAVLIVFYLGIFLFAEGAFILMALREYLQDLLNIPEHELMRYPSGIGGKETRPATGA